LNCNARRCSHHLRSLSGIQKTDMRKIIVLPKLVDSKTGWMYIGLHRNQTQTGIINTELMHLFVNQTANYMNVTRGALL
jgi:hypothetical protein